MTTADAGIGVPIVAPRRSKVIDLSPRRTSTLTDFDLLDRAVENPDLFAEFYRRHSTAVLRFTMRRVGCAQTAADITSETFASAFAARASFQPMGTAAEAWLYGIARNLIGTYARRARVSRKYQRRLAIDAVQLTDDEHARVEKLADMDALRDEIEFAMQRLPRRQADAIRLRIVQGRSYRDTAHELAITEGAARVRVSRGLSRLHELLADLEDLA